MAAVRRPNQPQQPPQANADGALKVAAVTPQGVAPGNDRRTRNGKFTLAQLRQTDGIVPLQSGTNQFDSQRGKTGFGMPRNTSTKIVFADDGKKYGVEELTHKDNLIRLQSGTNKFDSQKGMTGFGTPRDVKGKHLKRIWELEFPEEVLDEQPINAQQGQQGQVYQQPQQQQQQQYQQHQQQQRQPQYQQQQQYQQGQQQRFAPPPRGPTSPQYQRPTQPPHIRPH